MTIHGKRPIFVLTLEALPRYRDPSGMYRLKGALKSLIRCWGLRCLKIDYPQQAPFSAENIAAENADPALIGSGKSPAQDETPSAAKS